MVPYASMPRGDDDDDLDLPPLPPLGADEVLGTGADELLIDIASGQSEDVGLEDGTAALDDLDPASLLDLDDSEPLAPADASLSPGIELDLADDLDAAGAEYGYRDGNETPTAEEWDDHGISTLAELGQDDGGETGLDDLTAGLQGDDGLPDLPELEGDEGEPLADELDLGGVFDLELPRADGSDADS
ncbi:MAG: hypothetical protein CMN30_26740 [Sandaracinus sp.]|nr:hypothetical protein [Sandaracinus sp.]